MVASLGAIREDNPGGLSRPECCLMALTASPSIEEHAPETKRVHTLLQT